MSEGNTARDGKKVLPTDVFADLTVSRLDQIEKLAEFPTDEEITAAGGDVTLVLVGKLAMIAALAAPPTVREVFLLALAASL